MTTLRLRDGANSAEIALYGAELRRWRVGETELIWTPDPMLWADTAPILFPVVGWTRQTSIRVGSRSYPLGLHGFARHQTFRVMEQAATRVRLRAETTSETRAQYPFGWWLEVEYALDGPALTTRLIVSNTDDRAMPYACGLHPGFCWPFAGGEPEDYAIVFDAPEAGDVPIIAADGLFTRECRSVPMDGRRLPLSAELLRPEALCFIDARSHGLRFVHRSGATLTVALEDFPHIALWSRPPGRFLSIEAWTGHGDFVDADGDLLAKPSMRHLAPGSTATHAATFTFAAGSTA